MSRRRFLVTYDICDEKRLRNVFKVMNNYGDHIQYSVFLCELNAMERVRLETSLGKSINHREDQILFFDLGPISIEVETTIASMGKGFQPRCRTMIV